MLATTSTPASAQVDFTGRYRILNHWDVIKRVGGPEIGDYTGLPLNDAARLRADTWEASLWTIPEYQCRPHPSQYSERGFSGTQFKWWQDINPKTAEVIAEHTRGTFGEPERFIWMDGRPHPPEYATHTWLGFTTGKWEGNTLVVTTTHIKEGYVERNGIAQSDKAVVTENWTKHGPYLNVIETVEDPIYLTEPSVRSSVWIQDERVEFFRHPCAPQEVVVEVVRAKGKIPHILPGENNMLSEFPITHGMPYEATRGQAEALYPEYMEKIKAMKPATKTAPAAVPAKVAPAPAKK